MKCRKKPPRARIMLICSPREMSDILGLLTYQLLPSHFRKPEGQLAIDVAHCRMELAKEMKLDSSFFWERLLNLC